MKETWNRDNDLLFQFDSYCRKVVKFNGCAMRRNELRKAKKTIDCIAFDEKILNKLYVEDRYNALASYIRLPNISVRIKDDELYQWLSSMPRKRLEILLLSFFMEMSDSEIGRLMNLAKSTVQHNRVKALGYLKENMKGAR